MASGIGAPEVSEAVRRDDLGEAVLGVVASFRVGEGSRGRSGKEERPDLDGLGRHRAGGEEGGDGLLELEGGGLGR